MRFKNRYIAFQLISDPCEPRCVNEGLNMAAVTGSIKKSLQTNFGDMTAGLGANLTLKYFSPMTGVGILRVPREIYKECWAAMSLVQYISSEGGKTPCILSVFHVSGTIKQSQINTAEHSRREIAALQSTLQLSDVKTKSLLSQSEKTIMSLSI
ncbi:hypothetical protein BDR26DRAFT_862090 [Obelidium mucronatum]|nr:hypothetical protein BDR26DRAFT_862090 [Obelidium mucronatum]